MCGQQPEERKDHTHSYEQLPPTATTSFLRYWKQAKLIEFETCVDNSLREERITHTATNRRKQGKLIEFEY